MQQLPELPYALNALEPYLSRETIKFHYKKHHQGYVTKLNQLIEGTEYQTMPLDEIIMKTSGALYNNAAQIMNHSFYWKCLQPQGGGQPSETFSLVLSDKWVSFDGFKEAFTNAAISNFGSGWTWLVKSRSDQLEIVNTSNAETPLVDGLTPLLTCDVWEHAYYIDYRNARLDYINAFWNIVNWDFVEANYRK